jgi:hypothetical protein
MWAGRVYWVFAMIVSIWAGLAASVQLLVGMMAIDFLTGILCAVRNGTLSSLPGRPPRSATENPHRLAHACVVIGLDLLYVQFYETHTRDLFGQDRPLNIRNAGLL